MRAHEAGALHADAGHPAPPWLRVPDDVNALLPELWPTHVRRGDDGVLQVAGVPVTEIAREFGTPAYVVDEDDLRARARGFRDAFADGVRRACRRLLRRQGVPDAPRWPAGWSRRGSTSTCAPAASWRSRCAPGSPVTGSACTATTSRSPSSRPALDAGVGRIDRRLLRGDRPAGRAGGPARGAAPVLLRVTVGVEAHTHEYIATAHEDQKFGFSLAGGQARGGRHGGCSRAPSLRAARAALPHRLADLRRRRLRGLGPAGARAGAPRIRDEHGVELPELDLGGGFGIAYTSQDDPAPAAVHAARLREIVGDECRAAGLAMPRVSVEPGRAIAGPGGVHALRGGRRQAGRGRPGAGAHLRGGRRRDERQHPHRRSTTRTTRARWPRAPPTPPPVLARVVGKHCESGDIVVQDEFLPADVAPGDLLAVAATGAYCRSMASNYNHVPAPAGGRGAGRLAARVIVRRETVDDLLAPRAAVTGPPRMRRVASQMPGRPARPSRHVRETWRRKEGRHG